MVIILKPAKGSRRRPHTYASSLAYYMRTAKANELGLEYGIALANYINSGDAKSEPAAPRVVATGGLVDGRTVSFADGETEVQRRLSIKSSRSRKPIRHSVGSQREQRCPTPPECDERTHFLAEELGCEQGALLWALHGDTDHWHIHWLICTLDARGQPTPFGPSGRSHDAMQRAIARIDHAHGLTPESGATYDVVGGEVRPKSRSEADGQPGRRAPIKAEVLRWEEETGFESFTRYAQGVLAPEVDRASSWDEVQAALAPLGAQIWKEGSGGCFRSADGAHEVRLSQVDRNMSWQKLVHRFGDWSEPTEATGDYRPRVRDLEQAGRWTAFQHKAEPVRAALRARIARLQAEHSAAVQRVKDELNERQSDISSLNIDPVHAAQLRSSLQTIFKRRMDILDGEYRRRLDAVRALRDEIVFGVSLDGLDLDAIGGADNALEIAWSDDAIPVPVALSTHQPQRVGTSVQYWSNDPSARAPAFVDRGPRIWVNDTSEAALIAALLLAQARFGVVAAYGDEAFVRRVQKLGHKLEMEVQAGATPTRPTPARAEYGAGQARRRARLHALREKFQSASPVEITTSQGPSVVRPVREHGRGGATLPAHGIDEH